MRTFFIILYFSVFTLHAQNEANVWYFGGYIGLDFNSGEPQLIDGIFFTVGTGTTMSDSLGNFLFATDGEDIYNRNQLVMLNGDDLNGSDNSVQGAIILPKPGSNNLYYVFTVTHEGGSLWFILLCC